MTFGSDLICNKKLKVIKFVWGVWFLTFNIWIRRSKIYKNWFCTQIIFKNTIKTGLSIRNILFTKFMSYLKRKNIFLIWKSGFNKIIKSYWYTNKSFHCGQKGQPRWNSCRDDVEKAEPIHELSCDWLE